MSLHSFNLSKLFPPCPASQILPLPFAVDEMEFANWFGSVAKRDDVTKCRLIWQVLQTLNTDYPPERKLIPGRTRLFFLEKLGTALVAATTQLTQFSSGSDVATQESGDNDLARSQISVWSSLELANAYALLSEEHWFKEEGYYRLAEKTLILANGIQAMGRALLYISQTYTKPHVHFWSRCFQFYRLAQLNRLLDVEFNPDAQTIDNAFKRLLVFALCNSNQFSVQEMRTIYELLGVYSGFAGLLKSVPKKKFNGIPSINLKGNGPPLIADDNAEGFNPDRLYIATVAVASKILEATYDKRAGHLPADRLMLLRLAKTLTLNEQRKDRREVAHGAPLGVIGFENIIEYLRGKDAENQSISIETREGITIRPGEIRELDLQIIDPEVEAAKEIIAKKKPPTTFEIVEFSDPAEMRKVAGGRSLVESSVKLVDRSAKGYGLLWTDTLVRPKVGSIIGILHKTMTVGLIRWLVQSKETGMFIGVELLGSNAVAVKVYNPGLQDDVDAVYLPGADDYSHSASLVIMNRKFRPAEFIFLRYSSKNVRYRLVKQAHLTTYINHVEIVRSH